MDILEEVKMRLQNFGYNVDDSEGSSDLYIINFLINKVVKHIKCSCNISHVPDGLHEVAVDMVCGHFLNEKKTMDADSLSNINLDVAVKSLKEGDTQITYALGEGSLTPEAKLDLFIKYLIEYGEKDFAAYRCFAW